MNPTDNYNLLIDKINTFIRKYYLNNLLRGLIFLGAGLFSAYIVITLSEYFANFDPLFRSILFYAFIILNLSLIGWLVIPPLMARLKLGKTLTHDQAAEIIGKHFNDVNDKLLNTLQLKKLAGEDERHRELIEASIDQKIENLKPVRFPSAINIRENRQYLKWILAPMAVIIVIAFAAPSILTESTKRLIRHNEYFAPVAPFKFVVMNQSLSVVQGDNLKLDLKLQGDKFPTDIYVETANNSFKLDKENISRFHYLFTNLQQNTTFRLVGNGFTSTPYEIKVNLRPSLLHFDVTLNYPAYLHKNNETLANAGDITIPAGTTVAWQFHTQNATSLAFYMNNQSRALTPVNSNLFEHRERITANAIYKLSPLNAVVNHTDSAAYRINVVADEAPSISVEEKPDSVSLKAFYFTGKIQDDHGFSALTFHYKISPGGDKARERSFTKPVKAELGTNMADFFYFWSLKDLGIKSGDQVTYFFEVADNDGVSGPKKVQSPERTLNVPDAEQLNDQLNASTEAIKQKIQSAGKLAGQIEKDAQKLDQLLLNKNSLSFDEKKQLEDLLQKRRDLDDLVKQIQDENKKNLFNRRENQKQNEQLTDEQKQIEKLLDNVLDPKTQELLEKLKQLMQADQKEGTREQLSKMQQENKSSKREFARLLELYKKLEFQQKVNQNINQLNQLAEKQQKLADETKQPEANQQSLQQEQQKLNQAFEGIKKALDELDKANEKSSSKQDFKNPEREENSIQEQMKESTEQLSKNNRPKASQSQQQSSKEMKQLAQKMQEQQQEGEEKENEVNIKQLRELLKSLVNSSFNQEKVMETLKNTSPVDPNYVTLAQTQKNIKDNLKTAEDSLYALSKRIPQIESTVNRELSAINSRIDQALDNLGDRRTAEANRSQQYAMTAMNNLALMLSEALSKLQAKMSSKSGSGKPKPSMSQLSQMQQQLNQNMQKMREQMQQQGNKSQSASQRGQMSEQLAKMAREQQMIRQSMEQLNREETKSGGSGIKNADKISQQMEQTENDLVNRRITDEALRRQQQIQIRLLEAEKAEQEREQDQQREGHAGKDIPPGYIKALQDYQQAKEKQTEQIRTVSPALNLYYKKKIRSYFDQLNAK
jgi:hypothetical protein